MARSGRARLTSAPSGDGDGLEQRDGDAQHDHHAAGRVATPQGQGDQLRLVARARRGTPRRTRRRRHPPVQSPRSGTRPVPDATFPPCADSTALALAARGAAGGVREHRRRRRRLVRRGMQGRRRWAGDVGGRRPAVGHRLPARAAPARSPSRSTTGTRGRTTTSTCPTAPGSPATDLEQGPSRQELDVDLAAGSYEYVCDIHPNMVGTLTVDAANPP